MILRTILLSTLLAIAGDGPGAIQEVRITPVGTETEIVVVTSGEVSFRDFALAEPPRLILTPPSKSATSGSSPNASHHAPTKSTLA